MFNTLVSFVKDLYQSETVPLHIPRFRGNEKKYLIDCIDSTFVSSVGEHVNRFERDIALYSKSSFGVATVNGTAALQIALQLAGVKKNDEVITQALTFVATANAIAYCGADPIFIDVDLDTMGLSPYALRDFLEEFGEKRETGTFNKKTGKRISACVPMHTFGFMCRMEEIMAICLEWNINVVEDAAEALGSTYNGIHAGSMGLLGSLSFNGNKIITAGGGGAILTSNESLAKKAKNLTTTAKVPHPYEYNHDELGYNYRMPNVNAALLNAQLELLPEFIESKKAVFKSYADRADEFGISIKQPPASTDWNCWLISAECNDRAERDALLKSTNESGVMTRPIWNLMYRLPMYAHCQKDAQCNAAYLEDRIVNLPSSAI